MDRVQTPYMESGSLEFPAFYRLLDSYTIYSRGEPYVIRSKFSNLHFNFEH